VFYTKRFGALLTITTLVTSVLVALFLRAWIETLLRDRQPLLLVVLAAILGTAFIALAVYCAVYLGHLLLIEVTGKAELLRTLKGRWKTRLLARLGGQETPENVEGYVDRLADIHVRLSIPRAVEETFIELIHAERTTRLALEDEKQTLLANRDFAGIVKILANRWTSSALVPIREPRTLDDPVHGSIELDTKLATVLGHPMVQRLNRVRQLSFSYAQFPSSTHSRLSHSLGVARNAEVALSRILDAGVYYIPGDRGPREMPAEILGNRRALVQKAKMVGLLHDLGHGPFGHALDNYVGFANLQRSNPAPDKIYSARYILTYLAPTLTELGFNPEEIVRILDPTERFRLAGIEPLIGDIVDSSLDVDRMDYLIRDAHMTGLTMGFTNADALLRSLRPVLEADLYTLAFDEAAVGYMEHFLYAREAMYLHCYEHPRKRAAERIFERLIQDLAEDGSLGVNLDDLYVLTDEEILCALTTSCANSKTRRCLVNELMGDLDYITIHGVSIKNKHGSPASLWFDGATMGRTGDLKLRYIRQPAQWEESIASATVGVDRISQIQVVVPPPSACIQKSSAARILIEGESGFQCQELFKVLPRVERILAEMAPARARITVMCSNRFTAAEKEQIKQASIQELGQD
jgi:HD superfamily phosphohydrolase